MLCACFSVLELCDKGDLLCVLRKEGAQFTQSDFFRIGSDIANGMAYLESLNILHRFLSSDFVIDYFLVSDG